MPKNGVRICFDRVVPAHLDPHAEERAAALENYKQAVEAHAPHSIAPQAFAEKAFQLQAAAPLDPTHPVNVQRMAVINSRKWDKGFHLRCRFLDGSGVQRDKVKTKAQLWQKYANIHIDFADDPAAEVRISFVADPGSWSAVGKDCLIKGYFPQDQPTMNFGWLTDDTDDVECERVVVHEFGHALGCIHEHQSPKEKLDWNVDAVYAAFSGPPNNWSKEEIDSNILEKYSKKGISASRFDRYSIMLYQFDGSLFKNGIGTPLNTHVSKLDERMIAQMYPQDAAATKP